MTIPNNGFHIGLRYGELYCTQWIKDGYSIAGIDFTGDKIDRVYGLDRLPASFMRRLEILSRVKRNA